MNKIKRIMVSLALILFIVDPLGFAYEFNIWKYKIIYNPVIEEEIINPFTETHTFDIYINEFNKQEDINRIVAKLNYERIGIINTDNNYIYTIYINEQGKITKVVDGFDNVNFIAELSIKKIESLAKQERFKDITKEVKVPFKVKLKILRMRWF